MGRVMTSILWEGIGMGGVSIARYALNCEVASQTRAIQGFARTLSTICGGFITI